MQEELEREKGFNAGSKKKLKVLNTTINKLILEINKHAKVFSLDVT